MTSKVFVGPQAALEELLAESLREVRVGDRLSPILVVVPTSLVAIALRRRLARGVPDSGLFNVRFLTFVTLVKELAGPDARGRPLAGMTHELAAVREALRREPGYFAEVAGQPGMHQALVATLRDLENAALSPQDLEGLSPGRAAAGTLQAYDASRLASLRALHAETARLIDPAYERVGEAFARAVSAAGKTGGAYHLYLHGFHDFTELQWRLIGALSATRQLTVLLADEAGGSSPYIQGTLSRFAGAGVEPVKLGTGGGELQRVAASLFGEGHHDSDSVSFMSAPSELVEVQEVGRCILELFAAGVSPDDIAIVHHGEPYPLLLCEVFERARIPVFLADGLPLATTRYGKSLVLLLRLVGSDMRRGDVMEFLSFAPVKALDEWTAGNWEWITRKAAVVAGPEQWLARLSAHIREIENALARVEPGAEEDAWMVRRLQSANALLQFSAALFEDLKALAADQPWAEHVRTLELLVEKYLDDTEGAEQCRELLSGLRELDRISGAQPYLAFRETVELALEQARVHRGRLGHGHVFAGRPRDFRGMRFAHVFVVGLAERHFPPPPQVDSLLLEAERQHFRPGRMLRSNAALLEEERHLFRNLVGQAERLQLSYARFEMEKARPRFASPFLLAAGQALTGVSYDWRLLGLPNHYQVPDNQPDPDLPGERALWPEQYDLSLFLGSSGPPGPEQWSYLGEVRPAHRQARLALRCRHLSDKYTRWDGILKKPESIQSAGEYLQDRLFSASALQNYATCPQRFLMKHILRVEALDEPEMVTELSPLERGSIIHNILEHFYREAGASGQLPLDRAQSKRYMDRLHAIAAAEFVDAESRGVTGHVVGWKAYRKRLLEDLVRFIQIELGEAEGGLVPCHFEFEFGKTPEAPPVLIKGKGGLTLSFGGRIDRIDLAPAPGRHARVVDYKSGKTLASRIKDEVSLDGGKQVQLPLYLLATAQAFGLDPADVDASYFHINRAAAFRTARLTGQSFTERRGRFEQLVGDLTDNIQRGLFVASTDEGRNCKYCEFKTACPVNVRRLEERKSDDRVAAYHALGDIK
ncbi:MAG: PD-(D/E)XK nuclease family protein [Dehalococcoidia bacterium]